MLNGKRFCKISLLLIASVLLLTGCDRLFSTPIGKIIENPRDYANKTVTVSGEVKEVFGLLLIKYFTLKDKTGEVVVITERPVPRTGSRIKVKGTGLSSRSLFQSYPPPFHLLVTSF